MSSLPAFSEFSGKRLEKASFSLKCSLLSQYLKEKGSFGCLNLGMSCNVEGNDGTAETYRQTAATMNLFPITEKLSDFSSRNVVATQNLKPMDLFPQPPGFVASLPKEEDEIATDSSRVDKSATAEPERAQMTIFYAGKVIVFNEFPADKAKEVMLLASQGSSQSNPNSQNAFVASKLPRIDSNSSIGITSLSVVPPSLGNKTIDDHIQPPPQPLANESGRQARRASLHRFLEKRKDRVTSRAPYQTNNSAAASPPEAVESRSWLGLAAQSPN